MPFSPWENARMGRSSFYDEQRNIHDKLRDDCLYPHVMREGPVPTHHPFSAYARGGVPRRGGVVNGHSTRSLEDKMASMNIVSTQSSAGLTRCNSKTRIAQTRPLMVHSIGLLFPKGRIDQTTSTDIGRATGEPTRFRSKPSRVQMISLC